MARAGGEGGGGDREGRTGAEAAGGPLALRDFEALEAEEVEALGAGREILGRFAGGTALEEKGENRVELVWSTLLKVGEGKKRPTRLGRRYRMRDLSLTRRRIGLEEVHGVVLVRVVRERARVMNCGWWRRYRW
jgi:hypothetical protein